MFLFLLGFGGDSDEEWVWNVVVSSEVGERSGKRKFLNFLVIGEFREVDFDKLLLDVVEFM